MGGTKFVYSPQIHPLDEPECFSSIGLASLAVHFQSGNKNTYYIFFAIFSFYWPVKSAIGVRSGRNFLNSPQSTPLTIPKILARSSHPVWLYIFEVVIKIRNQKMAISR